MAPGRRLNSLSLRVDRCGARFRIQYSDPDVVGRPSEEILRRLRKEFIVISGPAITEAKLQDPFSRAGDGEAQVWTPTDSVRS